MWVIFCVYLQLLTKTFEAVANINTYICFICVWIYTEKIYLKVQEKSTYLL
jgi:hypothetical protein